MWMHSGMVTVPPSRSAMITSSWGKRQRPHVHSLHRAQLTQKLPHKRDPELLSGKGQEENARAQNAIPLVLPGGQTGSYGIKPKARLALPLASMALKAKYSHGNLAAANNCFFPESAFLSLHSRRPTSPHFVRPNSVRKCYLSSAMNFLSARSLPPPTTTWSPWMAEPWMSIHPPGVEKVSSLLHPQDKGLREAGRKEVRSRRGGNLFTLCSFPQDSVSNWGLSRGTG